MRADAYANGARRYDLATGRALRSVRARLADRIAAYFSAPGAEPGIERGSRRVLDVGCGTGALVLALLEKGLDARGVDISAAMLAEAGKRVPSDRLSLIDGLPLPYGESSFDASVLSLVLHESASTPESILAEALRIAPRCFVVEWRMPERNLDLPARPLVHAIERIAGKEHYANFTRFAAGGYLRGTARRIGGRVEHEESLKAGTLVLAEVTKS